MDKNLHTHSPRIHNYFLDIENIVIEYWNYDSNPPHGLSKLSNKKWKKRVKQYMNNPVLYIQYKEWIKNGYGFDEIR